MTRFWANLPKTDTRFNLCENKQAVYQDFKRYGKYIFQKAKQT
jgi:hypothetical protein